MTAGRGIAHAEHSPVPHPQWLHGVQLWVALPDATRKVEPAWEHHRRLPVFDEAGVVATVIMGEVAGARSPGRTFSPMVGLDVAITAGAVTVLPLEPDFEYAVLVMAGAPQVDGLAVAVGAMLYLGTGRRELRLQADGEARLMLLGGEPFAEPIVMWWNFVARTGAEIAAARAGWMTGDDFGSVSDAGDRTAAPPLPPGTLKPRGATRDRPAT
jgi:hypothetical protein